MPQRLRDNHSCGRPKSANYLDAFLRTCGDFGRYQLVLLASFSLICLVVSMHYYQQTIILLTAEHWCYSEELADKSPEELRLIFANYSSPSCTPLRAPVDIHRLNANESSTLAEHFVYRSQEPAAEQCHKWIYNLDYGYRSMTTDLDWVCQHAWKSTLGQSMFFVGSVIGTLTFGILADKIGRLHILVISNVMAMLGNVLTMFATDVTLFSLCRFVSGLATDSNFVMMYILVMEYIRPSMRTFGLNLCIGLFYCLGSMVTPWIAVAFGHWQMYLLVTSLPILLVPMFYIHVQESALWLISKNEIEKAIKCFERVAKYNGKELPAETLDQFRKECTDSNYLQKDTATLLDLFKTPRLRKNTLILFFKSMVITLCYDAISRNVEGLGVSPFVMFTLSATAILPACIVLLLLQDLIGRKAMASSSLLVSGIFTAATGIVIAMYQGSQDPYLLVTLSVIGRFGVTVAYNSGAQYATELIPTCVRGQGVAAVHVAGYALTFFSSYILYLSHIWLAFPPLILGTLCLIGSFLVLFLPETLDRTIPSTLLDGENFGKGERIWEFSCLQRRRNSNSGVDSAKDMCDSRTKIVANP